MMGKISEGQADDLPVVSEVRHLYDFDVPEIYREASVFGPSLY